MQRKCSKQRYYVATAKKRNMSLRWEMHLNQWQETSAQYTVAVRCSPRMDFHLNRNSNVIEQTDHEFSHSLSSSTYQQIDWLSLYSPDQLQWTGNPPYTYILYNSLKLSFVGHSLRLCKTFNMTFGQMIFICDRQLFTQTYCLFYFQQSPENFRFCVNFKAKI